MVRQCAKRRLERRPALGGAESDYGFGRPRHSPLIQSPGGRSACSSCQQNSTATRSTLPR